MAIRIIVKEPDEVLHKKAKEVTKITPNVQKLLDDMADTMYDAEGVGLAAPQVGILKRLIVIDAGDEHGDQDDQSGDRGERGRAIWAGRLPEYSRLERGCSTCGESNG